MNEEEFLRKTAEQYSDLVALNAEGALTPLVYKLDTFLTASLVIKAYVEADASAQALLERYEQNSGNLSKDQKEDLWETFRFANQTAAILKGIIDESRDVVVALPESLRNNPEQLDDYVSDSRDPEGLRKTIMRWLDNRFGTE